MALLGTLFNTVVSSPGYCTSPSPSSSLAELDLGRPPYPRIDDGKTTIDSQQKEKP